MTEEVNEYSRRVHELMDKWDCLIKEVQKAARNAGPNKRKPYAETIEQLITLREGTRRGLLRVEDVENPACEVRASWI